MGDYNINYDATNGIVIVEHSGRWDRSESNGALETIFQLCRNHGTSRVLVDHRRTIVDLDTFGLFDRGQELTAPEVMVPVTRLAFVHDKTKMEAYGFFTMVMRNRGLAVRAFPDDRDAAVAWLIDD